VLSLVGECDDRESGGREVDLDVYGNDRSGGGRKLPKEKA
jgi:hypothetical protein